MCCMTAPRQEGPPFRGGIFVIPLALERHPDSFSQLLSVNRERPTVLVQTRKTSKSQFSESRK